MAGGVDVAGENVGNTAEAVGSGKSCPDDSGNAVVLLEILKLHGNVGVYDYDDLAVGVCLRKLDHRLLVIGKTHRALEVVAIGILHRADRVVGGLGGVAGKEYDSRGILCSVQCRLGVEISGKLADYVAVGSFKHRPEYGDKAVAGNLLTEESRLSVKGLCSVGVVESEHLLIHGEAELTHCVNEGDGLLTRLIVDGCGGADKSAEGRSDDVKAPEGDLVAGL